MVFGNIRSSFTITPSGQSALPPFPHWFLKELGLAGNDFVSAWGWDVYSTGFNNRRNQAVLD
ncbi:MAG: hypothetical protein WCL11_27840, partial [Verrucomicrobiota bacterium]